MKHILFILFFLQTNFLFSDNIDFYVTNELHINRNVQLDNPMKIISNSTYIVLPAVPISIFTYGLFQSGETKEIMFKKGLIMSESIVISAIITLGLKELIKRPRPYKQIPGAMNIGDEDGYSMPSMHTSTVFALATSLALNNYEWYITVPAYIYSALVAYSRIHLGVHFLSDIIIGAIVGTTTAFGTKWINNQFR